MKSFDKDFIQLMILLYIHVLLYIHDTIIHTTDDTIIAYCNNFLMVIVVGNGHGDTSSNPGRD